MQQSWSFYTLLSFLLNTIICLEYCSVLRFYPVSPKLYNLGFFINLFLFFFVFFTWIIWWWNFGCPATYLFNYIVFLVIDSIEQFFIDCDDLLNWLITVPLLFTCIINDQPLFFSQYSCTPSPSNFITLNPLLWLSHSSPSSSRIQKFSTLRMHEWLLPSPSAPQESLFESRSTTSFIIIPLSAMNRGHRHEIIHL